MTNRAEPLPTVTLSPNLALIERIKQMKAERKRYFNVEGDGVDALLDDCWAALEQSRPSQEGDVVERLTRPIIGIHNRTALEVFDIMCDRIRHARATLDACGQDGRIGQWYDEATDIPPSEQEER